MSAKQVARRNLKIPWELSGKVLMERMSSNSAEFTHKTMDENDLYAVSIEDDDRVVRP